MNLKLKNIYNSFIPENGIVIAEVACGHEGSVFKFKKIIDKISLTKCKYVKSQIFLPSERSNINHSEWKIFNKLALKYSEWKIIIKHAKKKNLFFFADVFGLKGLEIAKKINVDGFKIHSEDFLNINFIEKVVKLNKPVLLGVGGANRKEIFQVLEFLDKKKLCSNIILMPGIQTFPTPLHAHSLAEIKDLINKYQVRFQVKVGCADHISGNLNEAREFPLLSLAAGACIIEKHFTIDRQLKWEDYESALDYKNFKKFILSVESYSKLLKTSKKFNESEIIYRNKFKKIPVAKINIKKNSKITANHVEYIKSDYHKNSLISCELIEKKARINISEGSILHNSLLKLKVGCIIVVRRSSQRLKDKAILKILNQETIVHLIKRIKECQNVDDVILATTNDKSDDIFIKIAKKQKIKLFRGDMLNVSKRFYEAAKFYKLDHIVRVTGDDILRDEVMIDKLITSHLETSSDVSITSNMPYGTQTEIFSFATIKIIMENNVAPENTEYLEWYLQNNRNFKVNYIKSNYEFNPNIRLTLDYYEDYIFFKKIFNYFKNSKHFTLKEVLNFLKKRNNLIRINSFKKPKFKIFTTDNNVAMSNELNTELSI